MGVVVTSLGGTTTYESVTTLAGVRACVARLGVLEYTDWTWQLVLVDEHDNDALTIALTPSLGGLVIANDTLVLSAQHTLVDTYEFHSSRLELVNGVDEPVVVVEADFTATPVTALVSEIMTVYERICLFKSDSDPSPGIYDV